MYKKHAKGWMKHIDFILLDLIALHLGYVIAYFLYNKRMVFPYIVPAYRTMAIVLTVVQLMVSILLNTFSGVLKRDMLSELAKTIRQVVLIFLVITLYMFSVKNSEEYSRVTLYITFALYLVFGYSIRSLYKRTTRARKGKQTMLVMVNIANAEKVLKTLKNDPLVTRQINVIGAAVMDVSVMGKKIADTPVVADRNSILNYVCREWVDEIFVDPEEDRETWINQFAVMGVTVRAKLSEFADAPAQHRVMERFGKYSVMTTSINVATPGQLLVKRIMDVVGGLFGTLFTGLLLLCVIPLQQKESRGPVFFVQERIGENGRRFKMYKIRSMYLDAEARKKDLMSLNKMSDGMMFKLDWDPRIIGNKQLSDGTRKTGIGEFIRKTSIDEFPQFLNVLKGEMSLVGTRPPTVDEWEKYDLHHRARMAMKPGITGMWQVSGRSEITDFEEVVRLDTEYIANWRLKLDLEILFKTIGAVLKHKGAI